MTFSFDKVYKAVTDMVLAKGLPQDGIVEPALLVAKIEGDEVMLMRGPSIAPLFDRSMGVHGKEMLGTMLDSIMGQLPDDMCVVMITEAYHRSVKLEKGMSVEEARKQAPASLVDDPLADEILMVQMYRPGKQRMGSLPILPGRVLAYADMESDAIMSEGRLSPQSCNPESPTK
jgi:hypothetical protein